MNNKKGISLIVLVITILVMIILAGVVVVSLQQNNPIDKAKNAKIRDSVASVRGAISQYAATAQASDKVADEMDKILTATQCPVTGYESYKQLKGDADVKTLLGVPTENLDGTFYVNEYGESIFVTKNETVAKDLKINDGTESAPKAKDGIVYDGVNPAA